VKRLVRTSRGWVELDLHEIAIAGFSARVTVFGGEEWASAEETWNAGWRDDSLAAFLSDLAGIPPDEAARIADESIRGWHERGGEDADGLGKWEMIAYLVPTFGLAAIGALALLAVIVFLFLRLV
jgi:hypothetical protein